MTRTTSIRTITFYAIVLPLIAAVPAFARQDDWATTVWRAAYAGRNDALIDALAKYPRQDDPDGQWMAKSVELLKTNIARREADRLTQIKTAEGELDKALAEPATDATLSKALRSAVELHMLSLDKPAVLAQDRVARLRARAEAAARAAEERGDIFTASELFSRLDSLYEQSGRYKDDVKRQGARLLMVRLYAPQRFWELRNERRLADGDKPLPPYNPLGDTWQEKLDGVTKGMVLRALSRSANEHVERIGLARMLAGGLDAVRTMATTDDIAAAFPRIKDPAARTQLLTFIAAEQARIARPGFNPAYSDLDSLLTRLTAANDQSVRIAEGALLHEFANGCMAQLDDFSAIIWPDEIRGFNRSTQGNFVGVGIQIQLDELARIKVVTPLEGTPAQRAGVRSGDLIVKVNGQTTEGFSLDQAVNVITGPENTTVSLTILRDPDGEKVEKDMKLARQRIEVASVKGWKKLGLGEDQWDWFVDPQAKIGYVRLTGFTEKTDREFDAAVEQMKAAGLQGMVLDLRFNPGGLMDQAVAIASRFIETKPNDAYDGLIVSTHVQGDRVVQRETVERGRASLAGLPVVLLVNEGSASASEIVSGAIQDYAGTGAVRGLLMGQRTYGKGSVQNVWQLPGQGVLAALKLTTQYYRLPDKRAIHRRPGAETWGVDPNLSVDMLPKQIADAYLLRQNADVVRVDDNGKPLPTTADSPNPDDLITKGMDLQLEHAVVLLQSQTTPLGRAVLAPPALDPARKN
jgi:carboxyl-terminal processing protease